MKSLRQFASLFVFLVFGFDGVQPVWGAKYPPNDNVSIDEGVPPAAGVIDVKLQVVSTNPEGVKFVAPEKGAYRISIAGGAFCYLPQNTAAWAAYGGWSTELHYCVNQAVQWGSPDKWGKHPVNSEGSVGMGKRQETVAGAVAEGLGSSATVNLDKGGYIWILVSDGSDYYSDNSGAVTIRITGTQAKPAGQELPTAQPLISAPEPVQPEKDSKPAPSPNLKEPKTIPPPVVEVSPSSSCLLLALNKVGRIVGTSD